MRDKKLLTIMSTDDLIQLLCQTYRKERDGEMPKAEASKRALEIEHELKRRYELDRQRKIERELERKRKLELERKREAEAKLSEQKEHTPPA